MHFVGIDLAWGQRNPTGVAVVDDRGRLVHVSQQQTDDDILGAVREHTKGPCVVALDAPLVVTNPTGNRPGEAALNADFGRFDAGTHPSNTGKQEFRDGTRGGLLAETLGLDLDPASTAERRAIEVYPHAATVALFRLGRILKYKNRTGRTLDLLRSELLRLTELVETLERADPPMHVNGNDAWKALVAQAETAGRKSELRLVEDQVDAVVCAYVALLAGRRPERLTTYGDAATGAIVTPTLPPDLEPGERAERGAVLAPAPPLQDRADLVRAAIADFAAGHADLEATTEEYVALVRGLLDDAGINYLTVTGRAKSVASFAIKAQREVDGTPSFPDPLRDIADQVGLRVITYLHRDVAAVAELLADQFTVLDDRDLGKETASQGRFGYASRHVQIAVPGDGGPVVSDLVRARDAQVQVRTVLQHAWAEFEHATRYKGTIPAADVSDLDRRFTLAAGLLEMADKEFAAIHERLRATGSDRRVGGSPGEAPRVEAEDLAIFLTERYAEAGWSRPDHYAWMSGLLLELGITSVDELDALLETVDAEEITARMGYRYPPGAVRRLDDALLDVYGPRYLALPGNEKRVDALKARLAKLRAEDSA